MAVSKDLQTHMAQIALDFGVSPAKRQSLAELGKSLATCQRCPLHHHRRQVVFGVGDPHADLMLVGEGPGSEEDRLGEPFVGPAGLLLNRMLAAMGLKREHVYIANVVKCRPPQNRLPAPLEINTCMPFLRQQIQEVAPKVLLLLGSVAAKSVLQTTVAISKLRGVFQDHHGIATMPTFHPAYLLRNPADKRLVWQDLQAVMQRLGTLRSNAVLNPPS